MCNVRVVQRNDDVIVSIERSKTMHNGSLVQGSFPALTNGHTSFPRLGTVTRLLALACNSYKTERFVF